jgi:hypothetical protein
MISDDLITIAAEDDGVSIDHDPGGAILRVSWVDPGDGIMWLELTADGKPVEATTMVRVLLKLGDRLRPLLLKLDSEAAAAD